MTAAPDFGHLEPMLDAAQRELRAAGVTETPGVLLAAAGSGTGARWNGSSPAESRS
jgi:hypothetical protein